MSGPNQEYWLRKSGVEYYLQQQGRTREGIRRYGQEEDWLLEFFDSRARKIQRPLRVLDFGCGFGRLARKLLGRDNIDYYGYDFSEAMCAPLFENPPIDQPELQRRVRVGAHVVDIFNSINFDVIFTVSVLIHNNPTVARAIVRDMSSLLKENGTVCLIENQLASISVKESNWHAGCWVHDVVNDLAYDMDVEVIRGKVDDCDIYLLRPMNAVRNLLLSEEGGGRKPVSLEQLTYLGMQRARLALKNQDVEKEVEQHARDAALLHDLAESEAKQGRGLKTMSDHLIGMHADLIKIAGPLLSKSATSNVVQDAAAIREREVRPDTALEEIKALVVDLAAQVKESKSKCAQLERDLAAVSKWSASRVAVRDALLKFDRHNVVSEEFRNFLETTDCEDRHTGYYEWMARRDIHFAHKSSAFDNVCHIFHKDWQGIRSAAGSLPGYKLAIASDRKPLVHEVLEIAGLLENHNIEKIVLHGMSDGMSVLVDALRADRPDFRFYLVWHGTTAQWVWPDERRYAQMSIKMARDGVVRRFSAIRRGLGPVVGSSNYTPQLLNLPPRIGESALRKVFRDRGNWSVLAPSWNDLRKNLVTNVLAAECSEVVSKVYVIARDFELPGWLAKKIQRLRHSNHFAMIDAMSTMDCVTNVTTIDCHPMVDLEAMAVGTPTIRGPLHLDALEDHPYVELTVVNNPLSVDDVVQKLDAISRVPSSELYGLLAEYRERLKSIALDRYVDFLEI
jgi:SAM-dependent methyltransferase